MAKVNWSAGIDSVSGALSKPGKNPQHCCNKMLLGTHRVAPTESPDCNRIYLRQKVKRSTAVTAKETAARLRFATVAAAIKTRKADMMKVVQDQETFLAQRDLPGGKKTMNAWYWYVEGQAYDQALANG